jgi:hypothetical protein
MVTELSNSSARSAPRGGWTPSSPTSSRFTRRTVGVPAGLRASSSAAAEQGDVASPARRLGGRLPAGPERCC